MDRVTLPGSLDSLGPIREFVRAAAHSAGLDQSSTYKLCLAVDEIATNIIVHGYLEADRDGNLSIAAIPQPDSVVIELVDQGEPYDPHAYPTPDEASLARGLGNRPIGGLGILLSKEGVDDLQYESNEGGNVHRFVVHSPRSSDPAT